MLQIGNLHEETQIIKPPSIKITYIVIDVTMSDITYS